MYPINSASPQRVAIGAVVQISDGAVQTSGVSVKVLPQGTTASAGGGTIAYEEGIVHYLPTQAETNYASFILIAYKTGCIPASVTVVTSASGTAGHAGLDWGIVINKTTTHNLSATTIKTATDVETDTANIQTRLPAALVSGRIDASVGEMAANVLTATAINADAITAAKVASDVSAEIADQVWDEILSGHAVSGSTGEALSAAGGAGDPWITTLPGTYTAGQAGYIVGTNLDALISSRMATYAQPTGFLAATFPGTVASPTNITAASGVTLSAAGNEAAADALLNRNVSGGSNSGRLVKQAFHFIRNKWVVAAGTLTVYDTDDTTSSWTAAVTGTAGADPVTGSDPA